MYEQRIRPVFSNSPIPYRTQNGLKWTGWRVDRSDMAGFHLACDWTMPSTMHSSTHATGAAVDAARQRGVPCAMICQRAVVLVGLLMCVGMFTGCATQYIDYTAFIDQPSPQEAAAQYRIASPDVLHLHSQMVSEVDGLRVTVRPDGTVTLPLLGEITVTGKTRPQLAAELQDKASTYYLEPTIDVRIERYASRRVFVFGQVAHAGAQPYDGRNTALQALEPCRADRSGRSDAH